MPQQLTPDTQVGIKPASTGSQPGEPFDLRKALHTVAHAPQRVQQMDQASLDATARTGIAVEAAEPSPPSDEFPRIPKGAEPYARGKYGSDDGPQDEQNSATMRPPGKGGETMGKEGQQAGQQGFQTDAARRVSADLDELLQPKKPVPLRQGVPLADVRAALEQASPNGNGTASAVLSGNGVFHTEEPLQESVDENGHRSLNGVTEPLGHMTVSLPHENGVVAVDSTIPDERVSERERVIEQKNRLREEIIHAVNTTYQEMEDTLLASIGRRLEGKHHEPAKEAVKEAKHLLAKATVQDRIVVRYGDLMHRLGPQELASLQEAVSRGESPDREAVLSLLQEGANKSVAQANRDAEGLPDEAVTVFRRAAEDEADETRRDVAYIRKN
ncbi:MAG: hypothetical protein Q8Q49_06340, partial [bacterium]|nr:hypothetical protein [bacterium]